MFSILGGKKIKCKKNRQIGGNEEFDCFGKEKISN